MLRNPRGGKVLEHTETVMMTIVFMDSCFALSVKALGNNNNNNNVIIIITIKEIRNLASVLKTQRHKKTQIRVNRL